MPSSLRKEGIAMGDFLDFMTGENAPTPTFGPLQPLFQNLALIIISFLMATAVVVGLGLLLLSAISYALAKKEGNPHGIKSAQSGLLWSTVLIGIPVVYVVVVLAVVAIAEMVGG